MRSIVSVVVMVGALSGIPVSASHAQEPIPDFFADHGELEFIVYANLGLLLADTSLESPERPGEVGLEYLAYRVYELLSPKSFRARLAKVTYGDVSETYQSITRYAVLIEDIDDVAIRNDMVEVEFDGFQPLLADEFEMGVLDVFQFMIGNTDWSVLLSQNVKFLQDADGNVTVVPFDFDWTGVVNAPYAYPAPDVPIQNVRERYYMGVCRMTDHLSAVFEYFAEKKEAIYDLYRTENALLPERRDQALSYFDEFYELIADEQQARLDIRDVCKW